MIFTERQQKLVLLALSYLQSNLDDVEEVFSPDARLTKRADDLEKWLANMNPMKKWIAEHGELTDQQKTIRSHIRGFCLGFTEEELVREEKIRKNEDPFRSVCIREIIFEEDC